MTRQGPRDAIAPEALPAIEALEKADQGGGLEDQFFIADAELRRLESVRSGWEDFATSAQFVVLWLALTAEIPLPWKATAFIAWLIVASALGHFWRGHTPRAQAIKRIKRAMAHWLRLPPAQWAFGVGS